MKISILFSDGDNKIIHAVAKKIISIYHNVIVGIITSELNFNNVYKKLNKYKQIKVIAVNSNIKKIKKNINYKINLKNVSSTNESYACLLIASKQFDCLIGGLDVKSSDFFLNVIKIIFKNNPKYKSVNNLSTLTILKNKKTSYFFSDCALLLNPTLNDYDNIVNNIIKFNKKKQFFPSIKIGFLSYSTNSNISCKDVNVRKITENVQQLKQKYSTIDILGDIQFDAAINEAIQLKKTNTNKFIKINTFIFPNLTSANIGYKIAKHFGKFNEIGPIILPINYLISDLSRGSTKIDILETAKLFINLLLA